MAAPSIVLNALPSSEPSLSQAPLLHPNPLLSFSATPSAKKVPPAELHVLVGDGFCSSGDLQVCFPSNPSDPLLPDPKVPPSDLLGSIREGSVPPGATPCSDPLPSLPAGAASGEDGANQVRSPFSLFPLNPPSPVRRNPSVWLRKTICSRLVTPLRRMTLSQLPTSPRPRYAFHPSSPPPVVWAPLSNPRLLFPWELTLLRPS